MIARGMTIMSIASKKTIGRKVTITKFRSWSPVCVKARGREDMHRKVLDKGDKPTVSMDHQAFGESEHDDDKIHRSS